MPYGPYEVKTKVIRGCRIEKNEIFLHENPQIFRLKIFIYEHLQLWTTLTNFIVNVMFIFCCHNKSCQLLWTRVHQHAGMRDYIHQYLTIQYSDNTMTMTVFLCRIWIINKCHCTFRYIKRLHAVCHDLYTISCTQHISNDISIFLV